MILDSMGRNQALEVRGKTGKVTRVGKDKFKSSKASGKNAGAKNFAAKVYPSDFPVDCPVCKKEFQRYVSQLVVS